MTLRPRTTAAAGASVSFEDGTTLGVSSVIWATGFGLDHSFVHAPVFDEQGQLIHRRGVTESPGLYFLGLPWLHTRGSALLGFIKDDARAPGRTHPRPSTTATTQPQPGVAAAPPTPIGEHA